MVVELYYLPASPPSRAVYMTLKALNLPFEPKQVNLMQGENKKPEYLAINPRGKVPSVRDGDYNIAESRAVSTYLCNQYEKGDDSKRLYPVDPKARGLVDQLLYISENTNDMIQSYVNIGGVIFRKEGIVEEKIDEVHKALKLGEEFLSKNEYMAGDHLTLADIYMLLPILMLELPKFDDFQNYPKTSAWRKKMMNLPYFEESNREGLNTMIEIYRKNDKVKAFLETH